MSTIVGEHWPETERCTHLLDYLESRISWTDEKSEIIDSDWCNNTKASEEHKEYREANIEMLDQTKECGIDIS